MLLYVYHAEEVAVVKEVAVIASHMSIMMQSMHNVDRGKYYTGR